MTEEESIPSLLFGLLSVIGAFVASGMSWYYGFFEEEYARAAWYMAIAISLELHVRGK